MPEPRRASRRVAGILAGAVVITAIGLGVKFGFIGGWRPGSSPFGSGAAAIDEKSPLDGLERGTARRRSARAGVHPAAGHDRRRRALVRPWRDKMPPRWIETLASLRAGFPRFGAPGRATAVTVGMSDPRQVRRRTGPGAMGSTPSSRFTICSPPVWRIANKLPRYTALVEVSRLWVWMPGRSLTPFEEQTLGEWKAAIHMPVVRCLGASDAETRMAAVACLGTCPSIMPRRRRSPMSTTPDRRRPEADALLVLAAKLASDR